MVSRPVTDAPVEELPLEVEEFLTWLRVERGRSANTLSAYRGDLRRYLTWLRARHRTLAEVDEDDVTDYVAHLRAGSRAIDDARHRVP